MSLFSVAAQARGSPSFKSTLTTEEREDLITLSHHLQALDQNLLHSYPTSQLATCLFAPLLALATSSFALLAQGHHSIWTPSMYGVGPDFAYEGLNPVDPIGRTSLTTGEHRS